MDIKDFNNNKNYLEEEKNLLSNIIKIDNSTNFLSKKYEKNLHYIENLDNSREDIKYKQELLYDNQILMSKIKSNNEVRKNPYFGRIKLKSGNQIIDMYIGEQSLEDNNQNKIVYDWRAPVASLFYASQLSYKYNDYTYKLCLKRKLLICDSNLDLCVDIVSSSKKGNAITDEFLKNILEQKKNNEEFIDIIKTIQEKQNKIIRESINQNIIVQGVAGSGKTVIILHRLSYLLFNNPNISQTAFLFITPNDIFKDKLNNLNRKLQIDKVNMKTMNEYYLDKLNEYFFQNYQGQNTKFFQKIEEDIYAPASYFIKNYSHEYFQTFYFYVNQKINNILLKIIIQDKKVDNLDNIKFNYIKNLEHQISEEITNKLDLIEKAKNDFISLLIVEQESILKISKAEFLESDISNSENNIFNVNKLKDKIQIWIQEKDEENKNSRVSLVLKQIDNLKKEKKKLLKYVIEISQQNKYLSKNIIGARNVLESIKFVKKLYNNNKNKIKKSNDELEKINIILKKANNKFYYFFNKRKCSRLLLENSKLSKKLDNLNNESELMKNILENLNKIDILNQKSIKLVDEVLESKEISLNKIKSLFNKYNFLEQTIIRNNRYFKFSQLEVERHQLEFYYYIYNFLEDPINKNSTIDELTEKINQVILKISRVNFDNLDLMNNSFRELADFLNPKKILLLYHEFLEKNNDVYIDKYYIRKSRVINRSVAYLMLQMLFKMEYPFKSKYKYIYIDEAQDYNDDEINLVSNLEKNSILNIYGDIGQNLSSTVETRKNWDSLNTLLNRKFNKYVMNENYRNTINIVDYCNKNLSKKMQAIGNRGIEVAERYFYTINDISDSIKTSKNVVITDELEYLQHLKAKNITCYTVSQSKGMEFIDVIVIDKNLNDNSKYVAYTRALNSLIVYKFKNKTKL